MGLLAQRAICPWPSYRCDVISGHLPVTQLRNQIFIIFLLFMACDVWLWLWFKCILLCNVCSNKLYIINLSHTLAREILLTPRNSADLSSPAHMCNQLACQRTHQQVLTDALRPTCVSNYWHAARRSRCCRRSPVHMCSQLLARRCRRW